MNIKDIIKKVISGEALSEEEKAFLDARADEISEKLKDEWQEHIEDPANVWIHGHIRTYTCIIAVAGVILGGFLHKLLF